MLRDFFQKEEVDERLEKQITAIYEEMTMMGVDHEDYPKLLTLLERCHELKAKKRRTPVSRETWITVGGNLLGILIIVVVEQTHVVNSKGLSQLYRPKTP